jgi:hypothetical protein
VALYGQAALAAKTAYANALARLNQRRSSLLRSSGFAGDIDPETGVVRNMRVDGSSKYGAFQLLNRDQAGRAEQVRWLGIERGLGSGGGLAAQMRNNARFDFGREDSDFAQNLTESLASLQDEQTSAAYARDRALYMAELEAARLAIQGGDFNPADFSGLDSGASGNDVADAPVSFNYANANAQAQKAAQAAMTAAKKKKLSPAEAALAARSAALNSMYKLGR